MQLSRRHFLVAGVVPSAGILLTSPVGAAAEPQPLVLTNPFFEMTAINGRLQNLRLDANGNGRFDRAAFTDVYLGDALVKAPEWGATVASSKRGMTLSLRGVPLPKNVRTAEERPQLPVRLEVGHSIGQSFSTTLPVTTSVGCWLPTWFSSTSAAKVSLFQGTPLTGLTPLATKTVAPLEDGGWVTLDGLGLDPGTYYAELSEAVGTPGWWASTDPHTSPITGNAFEDRRLAGGRTMCLALLGITEEGRADWTILLAGPRLESRVVTSGTSQHVPLTWGMPWSPEGYGTTERDGVLISRLVSDNGRYLPIEQFKRRPQWTTRVNTPEWLYATGTAAYDFRISKPGLQIDVTTAENAFLLEVGDAESGTTSFDVMSHVANLPRPLPTFTASDQTRAAQLSTFYWERAFSFRFQSDGALAADWQDWLGRTTGWAQTGAVASAAAALGQAKQSDDGYVWSFGDLVGWPFPAPNYYDTRHFTTNAMFVLGVHNYYSWTGDNKALVALMPKVQKAIDYYLTQMSGSDGLIVIGSSDHSGDFQSLGSNYWDLLSSGNLSAYDNVYFYACLNAGAELAEHVGQTDRAAELRSVASTTKIRFNEKFWDDAAGRYVQCVDADGRRHDYGATFLNIEAMYFGLATAIQGRRIYDWLDHGTTLLSDEVLGLAAGADSIPLTPGHSYGVGFSTNRAIESTAVRLVGSGSGRDAAFTLTLRASGPDGPTLASRRFDRWWEFGWAVLEHAALPAGTYFIEASDISGHLSWTNSVTTDRIVAYRDSQPTTGAVGVVSAISAEYDGAADIYTKWTFAPRATTRRNNYWYSYGWGALQTPWGAQIQDGGASLYTTGFDVMARAEILGADDAWRRLTAVLDRWAEPDHLCGGRPLYRGEVPQSDSAGAVGVDVPFPESALAPASFLYAFIGVQAAPGVLTIKPSLPAGLDHVGVKELFWHGRLLQINVDRKRIRISGPGVDVDRRYAPGESIRVDAPKN